MLCVVQVGYGLGGGDSSCVWLFWCSVICSTGQRATVEQQRVSELSCEGSRVTFPHSGGVRFLEAGQRGTDNPLSNPDCPL